MSVPGRVVDLVERFEADRKTYRSTAYKEEWIRQDFIDPLFETLGWDVSNKSGVPVGPQREVIPEDAIRVRGATKAPDYGFYLGGSRKFFVEAKKPSVNLAGDTSPAFQLRRYAWSAKLPLSVLTDFEEMALYDCRYEPKKEDGPRTARLNFLTYEQYPERWDEIASIFSKEAVLSGSLETYAEQTKRKRGTETVDTAFLKKIEGWRSDLARDLAYRNDLNRRQLNHAVQMTIDRIIFLRMAEDRGIEEYGRLLGTVKSNNVYRRLFALFQEADDRYNSGLFHFRSERDRQEKPDTLTPALRVDDELLRRIIRSLYYPESPYEFSVLPVDVLGQVYEQFLGKVIRLEDDHNAVVEEKPEVRKAGGVYYTPTYIVDYIVEHTVGKLLEGKRPGPRGGASRLKIVDPAAGSGSFLIRAYQYLLDWHRDRYMEDGPEKHQKVLYQGPGGEWRLTIEEKKRILTNNIFGVDIDPQAVEVTKLSLLLKVLEGETDETLESQLRLFAERALPDLDDNIKCGNSLIGPDFYDDPQTTFLEDEEHYRINVFDWRSRFPKVFAGNRGGFDAVIGNPPYIDSEWMTAYRPQERSYCTSHYEAASGNWDIFCVFIERALDICAREGMTSLIVPNKLGSAGYAARAREVLTTKNHLRAIRDYSSVPVFPVAVYPVVYVAQRAVPQLRDTVRYERMEETSHGLPKVSLVHDLEYERYFGQPELTWRIFSDIHEAHLVENIRTMFPPLAAVADVSGAATVSEAYQIQSLIREGSEEDSQGLKVANSGTIDRYSLLWGSKTFRYLGDSYLRPIIPRGQEDRLPARRREQAEQAKIIVAGMTRRLECAVDLDSAFLAGKSTSVILTSLDLRYLLGVLNSKLVNFYYVDVYGGNRLQGGYLRIGPPQLRTIPIRTIDLSNPEDVTWHDRMVTLVERMLSLHEGLTEAQIERERTVIQHQIDATDRQIDRVVYDLYGLTDEEIKIVEQESRQGR